MNICFNMKELYSMEYGFGLFPGDVTKNDYPRLCIQRTLNGSVERLRAIQILDIHFNIFSR